MSFKNSHAFAFMHTFEKGDPSQIISELQEFGLTGLNLALNYHASRDFLLRRGPRLEYLSDGFNYYLPNYSNYSEGSLRPARSDSYESSDAIQEIVKAAAQLNFDLTAWGVFLHNGKLGATSPECAVENALGNRFLSELCPSNPRVRAYSHGLARDLISLGVGSLAIESLHFHGARHGEHHERFFLEMSPITEFLFSLCFCSSCLQRFAESKGDGAQLKSKVAKALDKFLSDEDPWLSLELSKEGLAEICGAEIYSYLEVREATVSSLNSEVTEIAHFLGATTRFVDQTPLLDMANLQPLDQSWIVGINPEAVRSMVDIYEPLVYRKSASAAVETTRHYMDRLGGEIIPILRPIFPDNTSKENLVEKVAKIGELKVTAIDFYLLDTMRKRDLGWIKESLR